MKLFIKIVFFLSLTTQTFAENLVRDIPDVYLGENHLYYLRRDSSNIPFTGTVTKIYNNVKILEYSVKNGKKDGLSTEWNFRGTRKMHSIMYSDGIMLWQKSWTSSGKEFYGEYKNDLPWNGVFEEEFPLGAYHHIDITGNGQGRKYATFLNGVENGQAWWYGEQKDERLLAEGTYKNGKPWQGRFIFPIHNLPTTAVYLWEIRSFHEGILNGEVYYYVAERAYSQGKKNIVYEMIKQKHFGIYKNGARWQGMFIQKIPEKRFLWEQLFYEEGKIIRKEYTCIYSGFDDELATIMKWLPVKEEKSPDSVIGVQKL